MNQINYPQSPLPHIYNKPTPTSPQSASPQSKIQKPLSAPHNPTNHCKPKQKAKQTSKAKTPAAYFNPVSPLPTGPTFPAANTPPGRSAAN